MRRKQIIILPELKCGADGRWYVQYSSRNPITDEMKRFRLFDGLQDCKTEEERMRIASKIIDEYTEKLTSGWSPFDKPKVIYEDQIMYQNAANVYGRLKNDRITVRTYLSEFIDDKKPEISEKTYQTYVSKLRLFCFYIESIGLINKDISSINNDVIVDYLKVTAKKKNLSRVTMEKYQQILFTFFEWLKDRKKAIKENPVTHIPKVGVIKDNAAAGMPEHFRAKLKNAILPGDPQLWLCCMIQYYTAIRPGNELRNLRISDINFQLANITVKNVHAKNGRTESTDMPDALMDSLINEYHIKNYPQEYYLFGKDGVPGLVPVGKNTLRMRFNKIRDELNLPQEIKLYSWKHSGAQALIESGVNTYDLCRHLRHKNINATEHYLRKRVGQRSSSIKHNFPQI